MYQIKKIQNFVHLKKLTKNHKIITKCAGFFYIQTKFPVSKLQ